MFTLVVDDFGIQYIDKDDFDYLTSVLQQKYTISIDMAGEKYRGLTLLWDYSKQTCTISMPGYIKHALQHFEHLLPKRPQDSPHAWTKPEYGAKTQYTEAPDNSEALNVKDIKQVQEVLGMLLYYARDVDSTMLPAIGTLASQQANGTQATMRGITQLLNYCATHPNATVCC
jgi:hypothetical protein